MSFPFNLRGSPPDHVIFPVGFWIPRDKGWNALGFASGAELCEPGRMDPSAS
jgi:hypothetical protein